MNCREGAVHLIDKITKTISQVETDDYDRALSIYNGSTLGKHFRHIYDFFGCLVENMESDEIDYCQRNRDARLEADKAFAINKFNALGDKIGLLNEAKRIKVQADFAVEDNLRPIVETTIGRELMYAYDHAVHHLAIVKIGMRTLYPNMEIDQNLGVAASTVKHQHNLIHE